MCALDLFNGILTTAHKIDFNPIENAISHHTFLYAAHSFNRHILYICVCVGRYTKAKQIIRCVERSIASGEVGYQFHSTKGFVLY